MCSMHSTSQSFEDPRASTSRDFGFCFVCLVPSETDFAYPASAVQLEFNFRQIVSRGVFESRSE